MNRGIFLLFLFGIGGGVILFASRPDLDELGRPVDLAHFAADRSEDVPAKLAPLIDPAKLDTLKSARAGTPRLRKACYWLELARLRGDDAETLLVMAQEVNGSWGTERADLMRASLLRNRAILEELGCLNADGMATLRKGLAPVVTRGPYAGELATGDQIIPRSVAPELDNSIINLEFLPRTLNLKKGAKVGDRQVSLAHRWREIGLLSNEGLAAVESAAQQQEGGERGGPGGSIEEPVSPADLAAHPRDPADDR